MKTFKCPKCRATTIIYNGPERCPICDPEYVRTVDGGIRKNEKKKNSNKGRARVK